MKLDKSKIFKNIKSKIKEISDNYMRNLSYEPLKPPAKENIRQMIKKEIRMRKGREIEAEIENVFRNKGIYNDRGEYPSHINTNKKDNGLYQVMFKLPYGLSYKDIIDKSKYFVDALTAYVNIESRRGLLMIEVIKGIIPEKYGYNFNYIEHMNKIVPLPIGVTVNGVPIIIDIVDMVHILIGGLPNSGKSILMTGWCDALMQNPNVKLFIIDLAMTDFVHLKDHIIFGYDLDTASCIIEYLMQELEKRRHYLVKYNCVNIIKYNEKYPENKLDYIILIIDEFAFTSPRKYDSKENKKLRQKLQGMIMDIRMMSRTTGIHLIIAMQRPSKELIPMEIKSNFATSISFKMNNYGTSMTILGNTDAYYLPNIKGRMIFQLGSKQMELQAMLLEQEDAIRRLKMYDKITDNIDKGDDNFDRLWQYQIYEHTTKRLLPR